MALGAVAPPALAAEEAAAAARRFWGGLVTALGKEAIAVETVREGHKVVSRSRVVFGQGRTKEGKRVVTRHAVARWELVPIVIAGGVAAAVAAKDTPKGAAAFAKAASEWSKLDPLTKAKKALAAKLKTPFPGGEWDPANWSFLAD